MSLEIIISGNYSQKLVDSAKKSGATKVATDAIEAASKRPIQKKAGATGDLIGNKTVDKITSYQKNLQKSCMIKSCLQMKLIMKYQKKDIYLQKKDNKSLMN